MNRKTSKVMRKHVNATVADQGTPRPARRFKYPPTFGNHRHAATWRPMRPARLARLLDAHQRTQEALERERLQQESKRALDTARRGLFNRRQQAEQQSSRSFLGRMFRRGKR